MFLERGDRGNPYPSKREGTRDLGIPELCEAAEGHVRDWKSAQEDREVRILRDHADAQSGVLPGRRQSTIRCFPGPGRRGRHRPAEQVSVRVSS